VTRGKKLRRIWEGNFCVLCGGKRLAQGVEHAPPKIMFMDKLRAEGFEFPACDRCNNGSGPVDQLATFLALSQAPESVLKKRAMSEYDLKVTKGISNNSPLLYDKSKRVLVRDESGKLSTAYEVELRRDVSEKFALWAAKQTLALWHKHTGKIASHRATVNVDILTNAKHPEIEVARVVKLMKVSGSLGAPGESSSKQFSYKIEVDPSRNWAFVFAQYHGGLAFISILNDSPTARLSRRGLDHRFGTNAYRGIHRLN